MFYESILIGIAAWVYVKILLKPGMVLGWLDRFLCKLPNWLSEPLGGCEYCVAGQMAMWYYLYKNLYEYNVINHILFITLTIFIVEIINVWKQSD